MALTQDQLRENRFRFRRANANAKRILKPGDRLRVDKCPGTKRTITFVGWDGEALASKSGVTDLYALCVDRLNGEPVDFQLDTDDCKPPPEPRNFVYLLRPEFHRPVETGSKYSTIRDEPTNRDRPAIGDTISLRAWTGQPYRSKQRILRESHIINVHDIEIDKANLVIDGRKMNALKRDLFAKGEGFQNWETFITWILKNKGPLLQGIVIYWKLN